MSPNKSNRDQATSRGTEIPDEQVSAALSAQVDDEEQWTTDQNDDDATARADPTDQAVFRDEAEAHTASTEPEEVPDNVPKTAGDVGTTFPREAIEGPWAPSEPDRPYFAPTDPVVKPNPSSVQGLDVVGGFEPSASDDEGLVGHSVTGLRPGDEQVKAAVIRELREDAMTTDLDLTVEVEDGEVILGGRVGSIEESDAAVEVASRVEGVGSVDDRIEVTGLTDR